MAVCYTVDIVSHADSHVPGHCLHMVVSRAICPCVSHPEYPGL